MSLNIIKFDPYLKPYEKDIEKRLADYNQKLKQLTGGNIKLSDFANGYKYFGFHPTADGWIYREWAPSADEMYLTGDFNNWDTFANKMTRLENGVFEIEIKNSIKPGQNIQAIVVHSGNILRRVPTYATRVVQDNNTYAWCAQIEDTFADFPWTDSDFKPSKTPFIYECHIGMAQDKYAVGTYTEFKDNVLPRIKKAGYNTIQIMAVMEHPYYGSFGYQVANFFAPSSRFGTSDELKALINTAHEMGIAVLLDVVHSHAVKNTNEGLNQFDGTEYQFFHQGPKGEHPAWDTKLFNYGKNEVLHFLLSNLKYWLEVFHFDGFRFDGITSMLYHDHGLGSAFTNYDMYFSMNTHTEAITYLMLANQLIHEINPKAITIAEDMSGMPGMCLKIKDGGIGFDYRLSMGIPDLWIKLLKNVPDENWNMGQLWWELNQRRVKEKTVGYCESHDQALVGDKTIMFRLCDANMYTGMNKNSGDIVIDRGIALHKMIRLLTSSLAGEGYLNFMGNEFGHPEWIDFPREGNGWSYHYCRRQWNLVDNKDLRYCQLNSFDACMIDFLKKGNILSKKAKSLWLHEEDKIIAYSKGSYIFVFNFNPNKSFEGYFIPTHTDGSYRVALTTDDVRFGGFGRVDDKYRYTTHQNESGTDGIKLYLPSRTAIVLKKLPKR
ncbi:MAG: alpha amylase C-terminal domain-containing protein [Clostridia bacterium]|nr:alpha amylase C-terminal domain-containing protein [Clostridia bacterium]